MSINPVVQKIYDTLEQLRQQKGFDPIIPSEIKTTDNIFIQIYNPNPERQRRPISSSLNFFETFNINKSLSVISDTFNCTYYPLSHYANGIEPGFYINFFLDEVLFFQGIVDTVSKRYSKAGYKIALTGRSRVSILVDNYCIDYQDYSSESLEVYEIITDLISNQTDFLTKKDWLVVFTNRLQDRISQQEWQNSVNDQIEEALTNTSLAGSEILFTEEFKNMNRRRLKLSPGMKIWQAIMQLISGTGMQIMYKNNALIFGDLTKLQTKDILDNKLMDYKINVDPDKEIVDVLEASVKDSIVNRYSHIRVVAPNENARHYRDASEYVNVTGVASDTSFEATKQFVQIYPGGSKADSDGKTDMEKVAIRIRDDQRLSSFELKYVVQGLRATDNLVWDVNRLVTVNDEILEITNETLVTYGVSYKFSMTAGTKTELTLSYPRQPQVKDIT